LEHDGFPPADKCPKTERGKRKGAIGFLLVELGETGGESNAGGRGGRKEVVLAAAGGGRGKGGGPSTSRVPDRKGGGRWYVSAEVPQPSSVREKEGRKLTST